MSEIGTGQVVGWAWTNRAEIGRRLADLRAWFRGPGPETESKPGILILGPGGVGKTTLGRLLAGEYDLLLESPGDYRESFGIERYSLKDAPEVEVVVPPGQHHRREATWTDLHGEIAAGRFRGIILIAAYGYHTIARGRYRDHPLYSGDKDEFLKALLDQNRADELSVLSQLVPHLRQGRGRLWMLTLVAKQDLWWPRRTEVEAHYRQGDYGAELREILGRQDQRQFRHEFAFASLVISNFATATGERLKPNAEGYDHQEYGKSLRRLYETAGALKDWETGR